MAKKTNRRPNLPEQTLARARRELANSPYMPPSPVVSEAPADPAPARPAPVRAARQVDLRQEYAYVVNDLKNMGILAGTLMALLVVIALIL